MAKLLVQETNGAREFELVDREVAIGRELDNALRLSDPSVSRHHAVIRQGPDGFAIEDLQSSNGVLLNGARVPSAPLRDGDRITLGQIQMAFVDPAPTSPVGTVRMDAEAMARFRDQTREAAPPAGPGAPPAAPDPAPRTAGPAAKPGPAFLHPYLPDLPDAAEPLTHPDGALQRGDLRTRFLAALIDASPLLALSVLGIFMSFSSLAMVGCLLMLVNLVLTVAYLVLLPLYWMRCGASPGKCIMKLRVVPEADPRGRLDLNGAILRLLGYLANGAISWIIGDILVRILHPAAFPGPAAVLGLGLVRLGIGALPYLLILRPDRRALEDLFSRSIVIKVDR